MLPGGGLGEPRPPWATEPQPSGWDTPVSPDTQGTLPMGIVLYWWEEMSLQAFPWLFVVRKFWGEIFPFQVFSPSTCTPMLYLQPCCMSTWMAACSTPYPHQPGRYHAEERAKVGKIHIQTFPWVIGGITHLPTLKVDIPKVQGSPVPTLLQRSHYPRKKDHFIPFQDLFLSPPLPGRDPVQVAAVGQRTC